MNKSKSLKLLLAASILLGGFFVCKAEAIDRIDFNTGASSATPLSWFYVSSQVWNQGNSITLGVGYKAKNYTVQAIGGTITYRVSGSTWNDGNSPTIFLPSAAVDFEHFEGFEVYNPSITVHGLAVGASAYIRITGEKFIR